jgi:hemolysin D
MVLLKRHKNNAASDAITQDPEFQQDLAIKQPTIFLKQPSTWSRAIVWGIVGLTVFGVGWANVAEIEKVIPAQGKLTPQGAVKEVQSPISGVVEKVYVKDGDRVETNAPLLKFEMTAAQAQLTSLQQIRQSLTQENQFYRAQIGSNNGDLSDITGLKLPAEILILLKNRANLVADNEVYRAQILGTSAGMAFDRERQGRYQASQAELNSRVEGNKAEITQSQTQLEQTRIQLANARERLLTERDNLITAQNNLTTEREILNDMEPLKEQKAIPLLQYRRQKQAVGKGESELGESKAKVGESQAEINRLIEEQERIKSAIAQAKAKLANTIALSKSELEEKIAANQQRIAELDTQLGKFIVENDKKIAETQSQISQIQQNLKYHEIKAPASGTIFEMKAHPGFVSNTSQTVLEIVPNDALIAEVYITNKERGFVSEGMNVDVRIDSFDFSEFGDIKGKIISIGADALEPDEIYSYYRFPAKIQLDRQYINVRGKKVAIESGMSVSVNIKERKRKVITLFSNMIGKKFDSLQQTK